MDIGVTEAGLTELNSDSMNAVKKACSSKGKSMKKQYYSASMREFQSRVIDDYNINNISSLAELIQQMFDEVGELAADELPSRVRSVNNAGMSIAGTANEEIYCRCLESEGLSRGPRDRGNQFTDEGDDFDFRVFAETGGKLIKTEVKSEKARERASRSLTEQADPWILCSFFDEASDVWNGMFNSNEQGTRWIESSVALYVLPEMLEVVKDFESDGEKKNQLTTTGRTPTCGTFLGTIS